MFFFLPKPRLLSAPLEQLMLCRERRIEYQFEAHEIGTLGTRRKVILRQQRHTMRFGMPLPVENPVDA